MSVYFSSEEFIRLKSFLISYEGALKIISTKLDIMYEDFKRFHRHNPIEYIKGRIKAPESIAEKLQQKELDITADNAKAYIKDIAGIRIICPFSKDIFDMVDIMKAIPDMKLLHEKDYVTFPKPSGYRSYHLIFEIPVYFTNKTENIPVEVQIRTETMDFWSSLEHKVRYKYKENIPQHLIEELIICADQISKLDDRMFLIHDIVSLL